MNTLDKKRIDWLDMARGFAILLVIIGHIEFGGIENWIYTFHIPLFFFLSGCTFNSDYSFIVFLKHKIHSLLIPYFSFGLVIAIFQTIFQHSPTDEYVTDFFGKIQGLLIQNRFWDLWYIASLFWLEILFFLIVKLFKKVWLIGIVSFLISCYGVYYYNHVRIGLLWNVDVCLLVIIFFFAGYLFKNYLEKYIDRLIDNKTISVVFIFIFLTANVAFGFYSWAITGIYVDIYSGNIANAPLSALSAFAGIISAVILSKLITLRFFTYCGRNSLTMYALHMDILLPIFTKLTAKMGLYSENRHSLHYWSSKLVIFVLMMATLFIICEIINRTKLSLILKKSSESANKN